MEYKSHKRLFNSSGFTIVEVLVSLIVLGIMLLGVISVYGSVDKLAAKTKRKLEDQNTAQSVRQILMNKDICNFNFQGKGLNANRDLAFQDIYLVTSRAKSLLNTDVNFKKATLKVTKKTLLYDNVFFIPLELERKEESDRPITISIFASATPSNILDFCASVLSIVSNSSMVSCDTSKLGETRLAQPDEMKTLIAMPLICNGTNWIGLQVNGGMFSQTYYDGSVNCVSPNPLTGRCTCPEYYKGIGFNGIGTSTGDCSRADGITDHYYDPKTDSLKPVKNRTQDCGHQQKACIPIIL